MFKKMACAFAALAIFATVAAPADAGRFGGGGGFSSGGSRSSFSSGSSFRSSGSSFSSGGSRFSSSSYGYRPSYSAPAVSTPRFNSSTYAYRAPQTTVRPNAFGGSSLALRNSAIRPGYGPSYGGYNAGYGGYHPYGYGGYHPWYNPTGNFWFWMWAAQPHTTVVAGAPGMYGAGVPMGPSPLSIVFNLILAIALIALVIWIVRRFFINRDNF